MAKKRKSRKELARATLAGVTEEMAQPRVAESARNEEAAVKSLTRSTLRVVRVGKG